VGVKGVENVEEIKYLGKTLTNQKIRWCKN